MYAVSGKNTAAIAPATASSNVSILGLTSLPTNRAFWLSQLAVTPVDTSGATTGPIHVLDASAGSTATGFSLVLPCPMFGRGDSILQLQFNPPLKFGTNVVARMAASGEVPIGYISVNGYFD